MCKVLDDHFFDGFVVSLPKMLIAHEVLSLTGKSSSLQPKGHLCICQTALNKVQTENCINQLKKQTLWQLFVSLGLSREITWQSDDSCVGVLAILCDTPWQPK